MKIEFYKNKILFGLIIAIVLFANALFLLHDKTTPIYDEQAMAHQSLLLGKGIAQNTKYLQSFAWRAGPADYPPLIHVTALPITLFSSDSLNTPRWSFLGYWVLLMIAAAYLGRQLGGPQAGLGAALMTALVPGLFSFSHIYMVDFPLAVWVTCILALVVAAKDFSQIRASLLLGLALAAGLLTKPTVVLYVGPPIGLYFILLLIEYPYKTNRRSLLLNMVVTLIPILLIAAPWYLSGGFDYFSHRMDIEAFGRLTHASGWRLDRYLVLLFFYGLGPALCVLTLVGMLTAPKNLTYAILIVAMIIPFLFLGQALGFLFTRYLLPILPPAAIITAAGLARIPGKKSIWLILGLVTAFVGLLVQVQMQPEGPLYGRDAHDRFQEIGAMRPQKQDPIAREIADKIESEGLIDRTIMLLDSPVTERLQSEIWQRKLDAWVLNWFENASIGYIPPDMDDENEIAHKLNQGKAILACDFDPGDISSYAPGGNTPKEYAAKVLSIFERQKPGLRLINSWQLPASGKQLRLWANDHSPEYPK